MSTMSGADADALDALAGEITTSSRRVNTAQGRMGGSINSSPWAGPNADRFRQQWNSEYRRSMAAAAAFLANASDVLRRNADQQRQASGSDGRGRATTVDVDRWRDLLSGIVPDVDLDDLVFALREIIAGVDVDEVLAAIRDEVTDPGFLAERALDLIKLAIDSRIVEVAGYTTAAGTVVSGYARWRAGTAVFMNRFVGKASHAARVSKFIKGAGVALTALSAGIEGYEQWGQDAGLPTDERLVRAYGVSAVRFGSSIAIGAAIGTAIPVPIVGTVVGAGVGLGVGYLMDRFEIDEHVADVYGAHYKFAKSVITDPIGTGEDVIESGRRIIDGGSNLLSRGLDLATPW